MKVLLKSTSFCCIILRTVCVLCVLKVVPARNISTLQKTLRYRSDDVWVRKESVQFCQSSFIRISDLNDSETWKIAGSGFKSPMTSELVTIDAAQIILIIVKLIGSIERIG